MSRLLQPLRRSRHFSATVGIKAFLWGGTTSSPDKTELKYPYFYDFPEGRWTKKVPSGTQPQGYHSGSCSSAGNCIYLYGGQSEQGENQGSLFEFSSETLSWKKLEDSSTPGSPLKKRCCGMITHGEDLIIFGGYANDDPADPVQQGSQLVRGRTNELHIYSLTRKLWISPGIKGDTPPPCAEFTFTIVGEDLAVMFGGYQPIRRIYSTDLYVLNLSSLVWSKRVQREGEPWPMERFGHAATCLGSESHHPRLLITGGVNKNKKVLEDLWLLNIRTYKWEQIMLKNPQLLKRRDHTVTSYYYPSLGLSEVLIFGGYDEENMSATTLLEFRLQQTPHDQDKAATKTSQEWVVTNINDIRSRQQQREGVDKALYASAKSTDEQTSGNTEIEKSPKHLCDKKSSVEFPLVLSSNTEKVSNESILNNSQVKSKTAMVPIPVINPVPKHKDEFVADVINAVERNEKLKRKMANVTLVGLPDVGKTALVDRVLGKPLRQKYTSTGISEPVIMVDISPTSILSAAYSCIDNTWRVVDLDDSMLDQLDVYTGFSPAQTTKNASTKENLPPTKATSENHTGSYYQPELTKSHKLIAKNVKIALKKHDIKNIRDLQKTCSLYIRDTGGQIEFQESLSLLIYGPSIFIYVLKTNIDINEKHYIRYRSSDGQVVNNYQSSISTKEALLQCLTSIAATNVLNESIVTCHKPIVFIVGTHIDLLSPDADSVISSINQQLNEAIRDNGFLNLVQYADSENDKVMYTVDNTAIVSNVKFDELRSAINTFILERSYFDIEFPVSFLLFCLDMRKIQDTVLKMEKCVKMAAQYGIVGEENVRSLLHFLHFRVGIIQYFDVEGLQNIIIKEPQVLFSKVTDLLVKTFLSRKVLSTAEKEEFQKRGILEESLFNTLLSSKDKIQPKEFICFLTHLRLVVPFQDKSGKKKYFIPTVLNHVPELPPHKTKSKILPLCITFKCSHCPKGLFGMLVTQFINPSKNLQDLNDSISFEIMEDEIFRDQVGFVVKAREEEDEISLKMHVSHLEINYYPEELSSEHSICSRHTPIGKMCSSIRKLIVKFLQQSLISLHYDATEIEPKVSMKCPQSICRLMHPVKIGEKYSVIHCFTKSERKKLRLLESGRFWYNEDVLNCFSIKFSASDVANWMKAQYNLPDQECTKLINESITGSIFADLSMEDVKELGLKLAGRKLVTAAVERVKKELGTVTDWNIRKQELNTSVLLPHSDIDAAATSNKVVSIKSNYKERELNLVNVSHALRDVPVGEYTNVGLALGIGLKQIQVFEANHQNDIQRVWKEILQCWLDGSCSLSWAVLAQILMKNHQKQYAREFAVLE